MTAVIPLLQAFVLFCGRLGHLKVNLAQIDVGTHDGDHHGIAQAPVPAGDGGKVPERSCVLQSEKGVEFRIAAGFEKVLCGADAEHAAVCHDAYAGGQSPGFMKVVGDEEHGAVEFPGNVFQLFV